MLFCVASGANRHDSRRTDGHALASKSPIYDSKVQRKSNANDGIGAPITVPVTACAITGVTRAPRESCQYTLLQLQPGHPYPRAAPLRDRRAVYKAAVVPAKCAAVRRWLPQRNGYSHAHSTPNR